MPANIAINLYGQYEVPTRYSIYYYRSTYYMRGSISKKMFDNAATLALSLDDAFNSSRDRYNSNYINLNAVGYDKRETRIARISFTYQFGKKSVKASRNHIGSDADEQKRIGGNQ